MKIRLNPLATLVENPPESPAVEFDGRYYRQRDVVPQRILGADLSKAGVAMSAVSASDFVAMCMTEKFGDSDNWPVLAQLFAFA
jgi:hypothetical protein